MLSKKHNDPFYWKNKLEALESLPGEASIEKKAMWEKLDKRLHEPEPANKTMWYWMAAGLMPLIVITCTMLNNTENAEATFATGKNINTYSAITVLPTPSKETLAVFVAAPVVKKQPVTGLVVQKKNEIVKDTMKANENITIAVLPHEPVIEPTANNIIPEDTTATIAGTVTAKKKLPVTHINELETFPIQFAAPVNYAENIRRRKNRSDYQNVATQENRIGFNIKISSKN